MTVLMPVLQLICVNSRNLTMADVKRFSGRTYGKAQPQESAASKTFDDVFAKPKPTKWGNVSYVKPRVDADGLDKKQKADAEEEQDPFSFEFDCDRSPKKRQTKLHTKTVVMQPAVRITSSGNKPPPTKQAAKSVFDDDEDGMGDVLTVKKGNVRTYSNRAGRSIKQEVDEDPVKIEPHGKRGKTKGIDLHSSQSSSEPTELHEVSDDPDEGLYIEHDDGSSDVSAHDEIFSHKDDKEEIFSRPTADRQPMRTRDGDEITVKFRSQYLNPAVYSKFTENIKPKDPIGSLSNSKVVHKNVLKHDSGTTLIVVCSPKVGDSDIKQSNTQSKYFKDNIKDLVKSKNKPVERLAKGRRGRKPVEKDPFEMDDDPDYVPDSEDSHRTRSDRDSESPASEEGHSLERTLKLGTRSSLRTSKPVEEPKTVNVEEIVKNVKSAPPRKYHRIFRSRNKGYMEPRDETEEQQVEEQSANGKTESKSPEEVKQETDLVEKDVSTQESSKENGESEILESTPTDSEPMDTQQSSQGIKTLPSYFIFYSVIT